VVGAIDARIDVVVRPRHVGSAVDILQLRERAFRRAPINTSALERCALSTVCNEYDASEKRSTGAPVVVVAVNVPGSSRTVLMSSYRRLRFRTRVSALAKKPLSCGTVTGPLEWLGVRTWQARREAISGTRGREKPLRRPG
jgi:hypothetical protein